MVPREFLAQYLAANAIALLILATAFLWPRLARWVVVLVFAWAAATNTSLALGMPQVYLDYAALTPSALYRMFIEGWFSMHIQPMVLSIAAGQALIAALIAGPRRWRWAGVTGALIFLAAIAPLGVGSGFPFSVTFGAAILMMHRRLRRDDAKRLQAAAEEDRRSPLAPFLPAPDVRERHEIIVHASAALTMHVAERIDLLAIPLVSAIFRLRAWFMRAAPPPPRWPGGFLNFARTIGWGELARQPGRLLVMGAVTQPWQGEVHFRAVSAEGFAAFAEPDLVKIAWTIETIPQPNGDTLLRSETRAAATDAGARRRFRRYWRFARFGIVGIRWLMLPAIRREAERRSLVIPGAPQRAA